MSFMIGQFATQNCYQGKFGDEIASDQFGAHVMIHPKKNYPGMHIKLSGYQDNLFHQYSMQTLDCRQKRSHQLIQVLHGSFRYYCYYYI